MSNSLALDQESAPAGGNWQIPNPQAPRRKCKKKKKKEKKTKTKKKKKEKK